MLEKENSRIRKGIFADTRGERERSWVEKGFLGVKHDGSAQGRERERGGCGSKVRVKERDISCVRGWRERDISCRI